MTCFTPCSTTQISGSHKISVGVVPTVEDSEAQVGNRRLAVRSGTVIEDMSTQALK